MVAVVVGEFESLPSPGICSILYLRDLLPGSVLHCDCGRLIKP